jgi:hypothetical protein
LGAGKPVKTMMNTMVMLSAISVERISLEPAPPSRPVAFGAFDAAVGLPF